MKKKLKLLLAISLLLIVGIWFGLKRDMVFCRCSVYENRILIIYDEFNIEKGSLDMFISNSTSLKEVITIKELMLSENLKNNEMPDIYAYCYIKKNNNNSNIQIQNIVLPHDKYEKFSKKSLNISSKSRWEISFIMFNNSVLNRLGLLIK